MVTLEKFMSRVYPEPNTGCWLWSGPLDEGYGACKTYGYRRAHRVSYLLHKGHFDNDKHVLHTCDVPSCVNPDHLFLGTNLDNINDRVAKNRSVIYKGEKSSKSKITEAVARGIFSDRKAGMKVRDIMVKYHTTENIVTFVSLGRSWKHLGLCSEK